MRIKLLIEYDGTSFCGWQVQPSGRSVQEEIEKSIRKLTGEDVKVTGSGRTDSGVHASGQVAHFDTNSTIPAEKFAPALNTYLPSDVKVILSEQASDDFHARYDAKRKTYEYKFYLSSCLKPLKERYALRVDKLDLEKIKKAIPVIVGEHDFKCFCATGSEVNSTVREIYDLQFIENDDEIVMLITGNGFLYNMVRMIAGAMLSISDGKITVQDIENAIQTGERLKSPTLQGKALTLKSVEY